MKQGPKGPEEKDPNPIQTALSSPNWQAADAMAHFSADALSEELLLSETLKMFEYCRSVILVLNKVIYQLQLSLENPTIDSGRETAVGIPFMLSDSLRMLEKPNL